MTQIGWFIGATMFNHIAFYIAHRALHEIPGAYKLLHRQHHEYVAHTISISAEYSHAVESVLANFGPTVGWSLITSDTIPQGVWFTFLAWRLLETFSAHSGYDDRNSLLQQLGLMRGTSAHHHYHHSHPLPEFSGNYGQLYLDHLLCTMDPYLRARDRGSLPLARVQVQFVEQA